MISDVRADGASCAHSRSTELAVSRPSSWPRGWRTCGWGDVVVGLVHL